MKREDLLQRLRTRLGHTVGAPLPPAPHPSPAPVSSAASEDPVARFVARLDELGVVVTRTASRDEARRAIASLIAERGWGAVCAPRTLRWPQADDVWVDDPRVAAFGLVEADWALAETGTVVLLNRGEAARGHSLLPPASGFLVAQSRILPRLGDALRLLGTAPDDLPACISFVSGPSTTADISATRCVGVHGPGEVFVWLVAGE